jgi:hypothetical protein
MRGARAILAAGVCFTLPLLGGCTALDRLTGGAAAPTEAAAPAGGTPTGTESRADVPENQTAALPPAKPTDPQNFLALSGPEVTARLGPPDLLRRDGTAEVRQYRSSACILDLFLYPADGETLAVRHAELRGPGLDADARRLCLGEMLQARAVAS